MKPVFDDPYADPTCCKPLGNGFYSFSTHPIDWTPDGPYGHFGIKDKIGSSIVDEKYRQIGDIFNGLFPVLETGGAWGCVNEKGGLIVPCVYEEPPHFNKYGLAYGNGTLVDLQGNEIPGTEFNCIEAYDENDRYVPIILLTEEQKEQIAETGTAEDIKMSIFDTKLRRFVIKDIPDQSIDVSFYDGEPEPIIAAARMPGTYDNPNVVRDDK